MPSDRYVTTRIGRDYLEKLAKLVERHHKDGIKSNTQMLHRLIDDGLRHAPRAPGAGRPKQPPKAPERDEMRPAGLPPPE